MRLGEHTKIKEHGTVRYIDIILMRGRFQKMYGKFSLFNRKPKSVLAILPKNHLSYLSASLRRVPMREILSLTLSVAVAQRLLLLKN
jgi:hypothetical protein